MNQQLSFAAPRAGKRYYHYGATDKTVNYKTNLSKSLTDIYNNTFSFGSVSLNKNTMIDDIVQKIPTLNKNLVFIAGAVYFIEQASVYGMKLNQDTFEELFNVIKDGLATTTRNQKAALNSAETLMKLKVILIRYIVYVSSYLGVNIID